MRVNVLGPVEAIADGEPLVLGGPKPRALLAMLALDAGSAVPAERLIDGLWGERPPATAAKMVQLYVSQLRKALAANGDGARIVTRGRGYELRLGSGGVDLQRFERLLSDEAPREALALWRGPPLDDVAGEPFAAAEIRRLEELRLATIEQAIDEDLAAGRHRDVVAELEALTNEEPLRERLHAQRMLALYRSGRQADALDAYRQARAALVREIGAEPGPELRRLHEAILRQDPSLEPAPAEALALPPELETGTPLLAREQELNALREQWRRARGGAGRVVLVVGVSGIGKTRLAGELGVEVHRDRGEVLYASGAGPPDAALAALASAGGARRPTLLVLDDVDRAAETVSAGLSELAGVIATLPVLVLATAPEPPASVPADATLRLGPLGADGVRAVAGLYAERRADVEVPVERLLDASGGVPREVHRAAREWARAEAARRLADTAGRAAAERTGLRATEDDLAANVVELGTVDERATPLDGAPDVVACPFKGLAAFDVEDAGVFFGREGLVAQMVARLAGAPLMGIVGPSGSGKSSALRAGLLAALAGGVLPGSDGWAQALLRPGEHPLRALERATAHATSHGRLIVAVDQFEEAFTACLDEAERAAFVDALAELTRDEGRRAIVLIAVRADFYGRCAAYPELARLLGANHVLVGPMRRDELRRAIELPARRAGLRVEPDLVDRLTADVEGEPGALPLLSTSLLELWQHRDGRRLRRTDYEHAGGVQGAVARLAERAYGRLDPEQRQVARRILLRLAGEGEGDAVVRRRVPLTELDADRDEAVGQVLGLLADDRLVTIDEGEVEVAHEALLREWPRLRGWLEEDAEGRRQHRHLIQAARGWQAARRDPAELYRGARLASALDWLPGRERELNELERTFLEQSRTAAEHESERQRRSNRRLRALLAGVAALLALAVVAGFVALQQRGDARDAALRADAQRLGAEARGEERLDRAMLLARTAVDLDDSAATRSNLLAVLLRNPAALGVLDPGWRLFSAAVSPDGRLMAIGDERGSVTVHETATRRQLGPPYWGVRDGVVQTLRFSPDGKRLAIGASDPRDPDRRAVVQVIDPLTRARRAHVNLPLVSEAGYVLADVSFLPDGRDLVVAATQASGTQPSVLYRVDGETGAIEDRLPIMRAEGFYTSQTADRKRLFVTSGEAGETWALDAERLRVLRRYPVGDLTGTVSPDGRTFALGSSRGRVRLLDLDSGEIRRFAGGHDGAISRMRFTSDGRTLVTSGDDGRLISWDVERGAVAQRFPGHSGGPGDLDLAADGRAVLSAGSDGRALLWDLTGERRLDRPFRVDGPFVYDEDTPRGIAVSPDGRTLALTRDDGAVDLIDTATLRRRRTLQALRGAALSVDFSPDGRLLAVTGEGGRVTLWNARTLRFAGDLKGLRSTSQALAFSPDGKLLAAAEVGATNPPRLRVWDVRRRALTAFRSPTVASHIAFSPDGRLIAAAWTVRSTKLLDSRTGKLVRRIRTDDDARSVAFSPDGTLFVVGQFDGTAHLFSTRDWKPVGRPLDAQRFKITFPEFSPDGRTLATASADGTVVLWDVATQKQIGTPLRLGANTFTSAAFSPDGSRLFAVSTGDRGISFATSPEAWKRHACLVAGRELTASEWKDALPGRPYRAVCRPG